MNRSFTVELSAFSLVLLFGYTAFSKLLNLSAFQIILTRTPVISSGAAFLAWFVPLSELAIVLLLLFHRTRLAGFYASFGLLALFTVYILLLLLSKSRLPCSCGGVISTLGWWEHAGLNAAMMAVSWAGIRRCRRIQQLKKGNSPQFA